MLKSIRSFWASWWAALLSSRTPTCHWRRSTPLVTRGIMGSASGGSSTSTEAALQTAADLAGRAGPCSVLVTPFPALGCLTASPLTAPCAVTPAPTDLAISVGRGRAGRGTAGRGRAGRGTVGGGVVGGGDVGGGDVGGGDAGGGDVGGGDVGGGDVGGGAVGGSASLVELENRAAARSTDRCRSSRTRLRMSSAVGRWSGSLMSIRRIKSWVLSL